MTPTSNAVAAISARQLALGTALAAAMFAGATGVAEAHPGSRPSAAAVAGPDKAEQAVVQAEKAVLAHPADSALRASLGQAYLRVGRFASAADAFADAISQGDGSGRTVLGLALAQIANGRSRDAVATLDRAGAPVPAGDRGLAYALAGETARGVAILDEAVRAGGATPKLRQNLAYAYALDGRWTEARLAASIDVPADQLDGRLEQWAMSMRVGADHERIATLLGVAVRDDEGVPARLALSTPRPAPAQAAAAPEAELPAAAPAPLELAAAVPSATPAPVPAPIEAAPIPASVAPASAAPVPAAPVPTAFAAVSTPLVQPLPADYQAGTVSRRAPHHRAAVRSARAEAGNAQPQAEQAASFAASASGKGASHVVQLGAFSSAANARKAIALLSGKEPQLSGHKLTVTQARVHGRMFWRVAAVGFDQAGARGACSSLRQSGGACFAYAVGSAAIDGPVRQGPQRPALAARR